MTVRSLIYSAISNNLILFGGFVGGSDAAQDTWSYGVNEDSATTDETIPIDTEDTLTVDGTTTTLEP